MILDTWRQMHLRDVVQFYIIISIFIDICTYTNIVTLDKIVICL